MVVGGGMHRVSSSTTLGVKRYVVAHEKMFIQDLQE